MAEDHGVEPHQTMGERYLAVCGLAGVYLDHAKRVVGFAQELLEVLGQFNADHQVHLSLRIGIHSDPVVAAIVGIKRFKYDLWGETVNSALDLHAAAEPNTILVSQQVYEQLHALYPFENHRPLERTGKAPMGVWELHKQVSQV
ncbi:hypothetical protein C2W62_14000 [Candidatus Entotheonella serta]|nr:hypothetical protein C2W62_14000 [Candidatus Entotheonella serta]